MNYFPTTGSLLSTCDRRTLTIELRPGVKEPTMESIHDACKTHIGRYKLPRRIYYVEKIKRTPSGKADYRWAKDEAMARFEEK